MVDYLCGKFCDSAVLVLGYRADKQTHTDADERLTPATLV